MGQYLMSSRLDAMGIAASVRSAGFAAEGQSMPKHALSVLAGAGIDASAHLSTRMTPDHVRGADLILTMTGRHATEAAVLDLESVPRIYTLREFAIRASGFGPRDAGASLRDYVLDVGSDRTPGHLGAGGSREDIADPYGRRKGAYKKAFQEIQTEIDALVPTLFSGGQSLTGLGS